MECFSDVRELKFTVVGTLFQTLTTLSQKTRGMDICTTLLK